MISWIIFLSLFCVVMSFERASLYYRLSELMSGLSRMESYVIFTVIFFLHKSSLPVEERMFIVLITVGEEESGRRKKSKGQLSPLWNHE